jgi:hypothetical protein
MHDDDHNAAGATLDPNSLAFLERKKTTKKTIKWWLLFNYELYTCKICLDILTPRKLALHLHMAYPLFPSVLVAQTHLWLSQNRQLYNMPSQPAIILR